MGEPPAYLVTLHAFTSVLEWGRQRGGGVEMEQGDLRM